MYIPPILDSKSIFDISTPSGLKIQLDFEKLIDKVYISSEAQSYIEENVKILLEKLNLNIEVVQSGIYRK